MWYGGRYLHRPSPRGKKDTPRITRRPRVGYRPVGLDDGLTQLTAARLGTDASTLAKQRSYHFPEFLLVSRCSSTPPMEPSLLLVSRNTIAKHLKSKIFGHFGGAFQGLTAVSSPSATHLERVQRTRTSYRRHLTRPIGY